MLDKLWLAENFGQYAESQIVKPAHSVHRIMMVGAHVICEMLSHEDTQYLHSVFRAMQNLNMAADPDLEIDIVDMSGENPEDLLAPEFNRQADILAVCYVLRKGEISKVNYDFLSLFASSIRHSPHDNGPESWRRAALKTGAKIVMPFGTRTELGANDFEGADFVRIPKIQSAVVRVDYAAMVPHA